MHLNQKNPEPSLNPKLKDFWLTPASLKVLYGGRSSSKSWDCAGFAIYLAQQCKIKVVCARQFQNKIDESVYSLLKIQIERFNLSHLFDIQKNKITCIETGSEFLFYGIARNIDEIKGLEGVDILWLEEVQAITKAQWEIIEPTIRKEGAQIWVVFNPQYITDFSYQRFIAKPPKGALVRKINYPDNPFLSKMMLEKIEAAKEEDYKDYEHIYLGFPRQDNDDSIIKMSWIEAAVDAHLKLGFEPSGIKRIGYDVADSGNDANSTCYAHGSVCVDIDEWHAGEDELMKSCIRVWNRAKDLSAEINYDSIGVGAGCGSKFKELNSQFKSDNLKVKFGGWNAGGKVSDPNRLYRDDKKNVDMFSNAKAQAWWNIADRFKNTYDAINNGAEYPEDQLISISSSIDLLEQLKMELSTPLKDYDNNGKVKVESKKDLKKRDIDSPNLADAFVMAFTKPQNSVISAFIR